MKCVKCDKEATIRFSPDLDIQGIGACEDCREEIHTDLMLAVIRNDFKQFEKKYYASNRKID